MWLKENNEIYNLSLVKSIHKHKDTGILLYYGTVSESMQDFAVIEYKSEKIRDDNFDMIYGYLFELYNKFRRID